MTLMDNRGELDKQARQAVTAVPVDLTEAPPAHEVTWRDPVTGADGFLVVQTLVGGLATGGTRMRKGCTVEEVTDLARGMATKTATFGLPVGGAKGGIDFDPKDPRAMGVLTRFCEAMRPWLDRHWITAEDLGVSQEQIDEAFAELGLSQSYHAAIGRSADPERALARVRAGLHVQTEDELPLPLGDVIGGYGVAQACLGTAVALGWPPSTTTVAVQGVGTMGGGAAWYLHEAGVKIVAIADAGGTLRDPDGLDVPALLAARDEYGEIDRSQVPGSVEQLPRDAILASEVDILVPAAVSYAINEDNVADVAARVVVEAANTATTAPAEDELTARGVPVVPDFVANAGAAAWAWWLLQGQVGTDPEDSFRRLRNEMQSKVAVILEAWTSDRVPPRTTARGIAQANREALAGAEIIVP
ncbi:Glu/Leu/Phe/Val dehydrogenase dimerization domain-containing protein [Janibacter corallicola]|uniref:Glu/Leu/Phe/Val dehydrogenase dimerization domain-containing protein n=1 Tax=Janibacter corallicola TaxID=415212 RepID=UPI0009FD7E09|nr:Glu/Leu/Phe/Val dehydrogenase dimerization domain-containing protein [Janibacter corallicola]